MREEFSASFFRSKESNAFLKAMELIKATLLWLCSTAAIIRSPRTCEEVDQAGRKLFCIGRRRLSMTGLIIFRIIRL